MRRFLITVILGLGIFGVIAWGTGLFDDKAIEATPKTNLTKSQQTLKDFGARLPFKALPAQPETPVGTEPDPIIVADAHLTVIQKLDVPSRTDGKLLFIGTQVQRGEPGYDEAPEVTIPRGTERVTIRYRPLQEGDFVRENQMVALVDPTLAINQMDLRQAKLEASYADYKGAVALQDVYAGEVVRLDRLRAKNYKSVSEQEYAIAVAQREKYKQEALGKKEGIKVAQRELSEAETLFELHTLRNTIHPKAKLTSKFQYGIIKNVMKYPGESVKNLEPVLQIHNIGLLRAEGLVDVQQMKGIEEGATIEVYASQRREPVKTLRGHRGDINAIAFTSDQTDPRIISASEDKTARVWSRSQRGETMIWYHPAAVRAVACSPRGAKHNYCLTGSADGSVRVWDLDKLSDKPVSVRADAHGDAINCLAFSPDGEWYATGGEDNAITLWETETGKEVYKFDSEKGHQGAVTSLHFTPDMQLVSAGRDNTIRVWTLHKKGAVLNDNMPVSDRSGNVTNLGVSQDGRFMLFDHGKSLQVMSLGQDQKRQGRTIGVIQDPSDSSPFETFAVFSPDGTMVLTASSSESRLQLWRAPTDQPRSHEVRQFVPKDGSPATCAAFGVIGERTLAATGTKDGQVYLWLLPTKEQVQKKLAGTVVLKERAIEPSTRQARVWVEVKNEDGELNPGETVTIVVPRKVPVVPTR